MSISPMDLDSSLDDLIKKRKQTPHHNRKSSASGSSSNRGGRDGRDNRRHQDRHQDRKSSTTLQSTRGGGAKITKPGQIQRTSSGINFRLSTPIQKVSGPLFTSKNQPPQHQQQSKATAVADPSQIIITKAIAPGSSIQSRIGFSGSHSRSHSGASRQETTLNGRLGKQSVQQRQPLAPPPPQQPAQQIVSQPIETSIYRPRPTSAIPTQPAMNNFSIRGRSATAAPTPGYTIKGESGPTLLLVTGLDPGANDDDLKFAFEEFGNILRCEVLRNREGRSFGEAEVEFSTKSAALDCIARLDNQLADGRFLRVILRENKPKPSYAPPKPIQSVLSTPSYTPSGKMYSDQITSRYDIRR